MPRRTRRATSSGAIVLPTSAPAGGTTASPGFRSSAGRFRTEFSLMSVWTSMGQSTLTPMPCGRSSRSSASVRPTTANLDAQYTPSHCMPTSPAIEAVLTTWPPAPCAISRGTKISRPWTTPQKLTRIVYSQSAWVAVASWPNVPTPALLQTTWTAPNRRSAASASARTLARCVTSVGTARTEAPPAVIRSATRAIAASSRSARTIRAPRAANASARAAPMPPPPPVITATRSRKWSMGASSVAGVRDRLQREVVRVEALLDELVLGAAADGGAVGLVVHADHEARQHPGEAAVGGLGEGVAAHRVVEVLAGPVAHELPVDAIHLLVEVHHDLAEVVVGVGRDALDDPGRTGPEDEVLGDEPGRALVLAGLEVRAQRRRVDQ